MIEHPAPPMVLVSHEAGAWHITAMWPDALVPELSHKFKYDGPDFEQGWRLVGSQIKGWLDCLEDEGGTP